MNRLTITASSAVLLLALLSGCPGTPEPTDTASVPDTNLAVRDEICETLPVTDSVAVPDSTPAKPKPKSEPKPKPEPKPKKTKPKKTKPASETKPSGTAQGESKEIETSGVSGSPFAGATIDNASFNYPYWFTQTFNKIAVNWKNPIVYDGTLICTIYFQVIKSGRIIELRIEKSSGIPEFDESCMRAVSGAAPFPPLPRQFRDEIIGLTLPFKHSPR